MQDFLTTLLQCSVSMSLVTLVYAAILPLLSKRYAAKWRYMIWLVIAAGWLFPFRPRIDLSFLPAQMADKPVTPMHLLPTTNTTISSPIPISGDIVNLPTGVPIWWMLTVIWILGIVGVILYHALRHGRFLKMVRRWSEPVTDLESLSILDGIKSDLKIKEHVGLNICLGITSPMMIGFFRPVILLPPVKMRNIELSFILKHELIHFKRHDLWYKALILGATTLHWFNPVVYLMAKAATAQCEISCDELLLRDSSFQQRKLYGEAIIGIVRHGLVTRTALSTNFYGGKRDMQIRISSIMEPSKKRTGSVILCVVLASMMGTGMALASTHVTAVHNNNQAKLAISDPSNLTLTDFKNAKRLDEIIGEPGWEDTNLFILAELPADDITLYGMKDKDGIYTNVAIRSGKTINYYDWSYYAGVFDAGMSYQDYDGDGTKELAVHLYFGGGTGVSIDQLFMLEELRPGVFESIQFISDDYTTQVNNIVSYRVNEENKTISLFNDGTELQKVDISWLKENEKVENLYYGNQVSFDFNHGIVMRITPGMEINDRVDLQYDGFSELEATIEYQSDGTFHITNIR